MRTTWIVLWSICFSMAPLWIPSGAWADPTTGKCAKIGDDIWEKKELPKNQSSIDMLKKIAVDCPAIAGSMERLANSIKAYLEKLAEDSGNVKKVGEAYRNPAYNPGGFTPDWF